MTSNSNKLLSTILFEYSLFDVADNLKLFKLKIIILIIMRDLLLSNLIVHKSVIVEEISPLLNAFSDSGIVNLSVLLDLLRVLSWFVFSDLDFSSLFIDFISDFVICLFDVAFNFFSLQVLLVVFDYPYSRLIFALIVYLIICAP